MLPWCNGSHDRLKICCLVRPGSSPGGSTKTKKYKHMCKSSIEYAELSGLKIAKANLEITPIEYQDEQYVNIIEWLSQRIKELEKL